MPIIAADKPQLDPKVPPDDQVKGYLRVAHTAYVHLTCGTVTSQPWTKSEERAKEPDKIATLHCDRDKADFPSSEFVWYRTQQTPGT